MEFQIYNLQWYIRFGGRKQHQCCAHYLCDFLNQWKLSCSSQLVLHRLKCVHKYSGWRDIIISSIAVELTKFKSMHVRSTRTCISLNHFHSMAVALQCFNRLLKINSIIEKKILKCSLCLEKLNGLLFSATHPQYTMQMYGTQLQYCTMHSESTLSTPIGVAL